jgi:hypothetical protein
MKCRQVNVLAFEPAGTRGPWVSRVAELLGDQNMVLLARCDADAPLSRWQHIPM